MDWLQNLLGNSLINAMGWTLVHSIWQISIWAMIAVVILVITHKRKANIRYRLLALVFLGICTTSTITFRNHFTKANSVLENTVIQGEIEHLDIADNEINQQEIEESSETNIKIISWFQNYFDKHLPAIVTVWFLGFVFFLLRYFGSIAWLLRLKNTSETITTEYEDILYKYSRKMKLRRLVEIGKSLKIDTPMVIGHFKPVILFPAKILTGLSLEQLEAILLHELAHVKRNDFLINLVQSFIEIVFFYHPAVWWLSASISTEREHVCDDLAVKGGVDALQMAETLAKLAEVFTRPPQFSQAFSGKQHKVKNRIHRLIFNENMKTNLSQKIIVAAGIILSVTTLSFTIQKDILIEKNTTHDTTQVQLAETAKNTIALQSEPKLKEEETKEKQVNVSEERNQNQNQNSTEQKDILEATSEKKLEHRHAIMVANIERRINDLITECISLESNGKDGFGKYYESELDRIIEEENESLIEWLIHQESMALMEKDYKKLKEEIRQEYITNRNHSEKSTKNLDSNDSNTEEEITGESLKTLMKKGAKDWNKYRKNHPGENFDEALKESNLTGFNLSNFDLSYMNLKEATLTNCNFTNANMTGVNIKEAELSGTVLEKANLTKANMKELVLNGINLKGAILTSANLKEITLKNCDLSGANLVGTVMYESIIENCKFKGAVADHTTQFPPGFDWAQQGIEFK